MTSGLRPAASSWLAGAVVGSAAGLLLAEWPTAGALIAIAFAIPAAVSRQRLAGIGGLLVGLPAAWLTIIGLATLRCAEFDAGLGQECAMSDATGWLIVAAILLAVGVVATAIAVRRGRS